MSGLKKLSSGIYVYSFKGKDGVYQIKALNQSQSYQLNVWWTKIKCSLSSYGINTWS